MPLDIKTVQQQLSKSLPPRLCRMKDRYFSIKPSLSIERAKAFTKITKQYLGLDPRLLKGRCIYHACETAPLYIGEDELIVGHSGGRPRAGIFSPDIAWKWVELEIDTLDKRSVDPYELRDEDREFLKKEIFPFWRGKSIDEICYKKFDEANLLDLTFKSGIIDCEVKTASGGGDLCPGYANILLKKGFAGIKREALSKLSTLREDRAEDRNKINFLQSVVTTCEGLILLANRYSEKALQLSKEEKNAKRKDELLKISQILKKVPAYPAETLWEALQSIWFAQTVLYLEELTAGTSIGRVDQYLYPYFKNDVESGRLTLQEAEELFYCFMYKFNEHVWPLSEFGSKYFSGYMPYQNMIVGGITKEGSDGVNALSYLLMNCSKHLQMIQPSFSARLHDDSPKEYLMAIGDLVAQGLGFPSIQTDKVAIESLLSLDISLEDARDYAIMGCTEPLIAGKQVRWTSATYTNFGIPFELVFTNGIHRRTGKKVGLETGPLSSFDTFEKFEAAVKQQLSFILKKCAVATRIVQEVHRQHAPKPMGSSLIEGPVEKGIDYIEGGATYNSGPGIVCIGTAEYANSMYAVRALVYDQRKITLDEMEKALSSNFEGYSEILKECQCAAKYGNDIPIVDHYAQDVINFSYDEIRQLQGLFSPLELSTLSVSSNIPQGEAISALPSGRRAYAPLSDGVSPSQGSDKNGPTSAMKSVDSLPHWKNTAGTLYNMTLTPSLFQSQESKEQFVALLRAHNALGGAQIQFNCVTKETLLEAQKHPEQHRSLMVRVAGYSAFFTEITKELQDDIISRTEQKHF